MVHSKVSVESFFINSKDLMFVLDSSWELKECNPAFVKALGYSKSNFDFIKLTDLIHADDYERILSLWNGADAIEDENNFRFINSSGDYLWFSFVSSFIQTGLLYITCRTISTPINAKGVIETNHLLNEIINLVPYPIFLKDEFGKYLLINQAQSELFSCEANEILGKDDSSFINNPEEYQGVLESDHEVIHKHKIVDLPVQIITTANGSRRTLHTTKVPLFSPVDRKVYVLGVSIDLTELKKYETALRQSEEKYKSLVELSPDAIIILENGKIIFINDSGRDLLKAASSDVLMGRKFFDFIHPDFHNAIIERNKLLKKGERVSALEEKFIQLDGSLVDVEVSSIPFFYNNKFAIQIIARDITDRLKARENLFKRKQQFEALAENSQDIIARFNKNYEHLYINRSITRYIPKPQQDFINNKISQVGYPETLNKNIEKFINKVFKTGKPVSTYFTLSTQEGLKYCFATVVPERNKDDEVVSVLCTVRDISELKMKENELLSINKELNTFIYKASHDLKGPLSTIIGLANLSFMYPDQSQSQQVFGLIYQTALNLNLVLRKLLEVVQIRDAPLSIQPISLEMIIKSLLTELIKKKELEGIEINCTYHQGGILKSDPQMVEHIFKNIIANSITYKNKELAFININTEEAKGGILITISDNGEGIEDKVKDKIFDMFYRGNVNSKGSGLGLYLVKNAVMRINGTINVESVVDKGTTFKIYIPNYAQKNSGM
jgi:PAS domain S-box-containing protein